MPRRSGRLPPLSALLSVDDDAGTTQKSHVPDSRTTPPAASSAVVTQPPFSSPPRPLYLQRQSRDAARALGPFRPDPVMGGSNQSTDARTSLLHNGATPGVCQARNVDNPSPVFAGDTHVAHTNRSDDGVPSGGTLLYRSREGEFRDSAAVGLGSRPEHTIELDDDSDGGRRPAPPPSEASTSGSWAAPLIAHKRRCAKSKATGADGARPSKRRKQAVSVAAGGHDEFKTRGVGSPKYRLLVHKRWAKFVDAQLSSDGASKQLSVPNAAGWVTIRL